MTLVRRRRLLAGFVVVVVAIVAVAVAGATAYFTFVEGSDVAVSRVGEGEGLPADPPGHPVPVASTVAPDPGPVPDDHDLSPDVLAAAVQSSVRVSGRSCGIWVEGSGFAVAEGDLIATNAHLMRGLNEPEVELADGRILTAIVVAVDTVNDLALLRAQGADLEPLMLTEAAESAPVGAVLAWEAKGNPDPTPFRIDRPVTVRTSIVGGREIIERASWLVAAQTESGDSGAALATYIDDRLAVLGVAWGASTAGGVTYATRAGRLQELLSSSVLDQPVDPPGCDS